MFIGELQHKKKKNLHHVAQETLLGDACKGCNVLKANAVVGDFRNSGQFWSQLVPL